MILRIILQLTTQTVKFYSRRYYDTPPQPLEFVPKFNTTTLLHKHPVFNHCIYRMLRDIQWEQYQKTTSTWTILTGSRVYQRPPTETYIRFKQTSDNVDFFVLNAVTELVNVVYLTDRIIITSTVVWTPSGSFYIYFDPGVLVEASTCSKEAMPISDPNFWPFNIPYETTITSTSN